VRDEQVRRYARHILLPDVGGLGQTALLSASAGQTLRLRFAETDNVFTFQLGVDNVSLDVQAIPEPGTWLLLSTGLLGLIGYGWQRHREPRA